MENSFIMEGIITIFIVVLCFLCIVYLLSKVKWTMLFDREEWYDPIQKRINFGICILAFLMYLTIPIFTRHLDNLNYANKCVKFVNKKIINKQLPNILIFSNEEYLKTNESFYKTKKVGETINSQNECKLVKPEDK